MTATTLSPSCDWNSLVSCCFAGSLNVVPHLNCECAPLSRAPSRSPPLLRSLACRAINSLGRARTSGSATTARHLQTICDNVCDGGSAVAARAWLCQAWRAVQLIHAHTHSYYVPVHLQIHTYVCTYIISIALVFVFMFFLRKGLIILS